MPWSALGRGGLTSTSSLDAAGGGGRGICPNACCFHPLPLAQLVLTFELGFLNPGEQRREQPRLMQRNTVLKH